MLKQLVDAICFRLINGPLNGPSFPPFAISRMTLGPDDIVGRRHPKKLPEHAVLRIKHIAREALGARKCLVLNDGLDIGILSEVEIDRRAA